MGIQDRDYWVEKYASLTQPQKGSGQGKPPPSNPSSVAGAYKEEYDNSLRPMRRSSESPPFTSKWVCYAFFSAGFVLGSVWDNVIELIRRGF